MVWNYEFVFDSIIFFFAKFSSKSSFRRLNTNLTEIICEWIYVTLALYHLLNSENFVLQLINVIRFNVCSKFCIFLIVPPISFFLFQWRREMAFTSAGTSSNFQSLFSIFCTLLSTVVNTFRIKFRRYVTSLDSFPWSTIYLLSLSKFAVSAELLLINVLTNHI